MVTTAIAASTLLMFLLGLAVTFAATERTLLSNARLQIAVGERYPTEGRALLQQMNATRDAPCSEADITNVRRLLMNARYIKDAGRMHEAHLACSASLQPAELLANRYKPEFREADGVFVYTKIKSLNMGGMTPIVLRLDDSYVALDPHTQNEMPAGMRFALTKLDASSDANHLGGAPIVVQGDALLKNGYGRYGDSLYATACSLRFRTCMTTVMTIHQVLGEHRHALVLWMVAGAFAGAWLGFLWVAFYRLRRGIEHQLRRAIRRDALRVVYQPLVDIGTGTLVGAEALVRWTDEDKVAIAPDMFIKIAEERGFVNEITRLVVRHVLTDFAEYLVANPEFRINVNIAASDLTDPRFQPMLAGQLEQVQVAPRSLGIELTEGATARHETAIQAIAQLRQRGHKVYIDDFGTGYSSLAYLKDLAVDGIKIDRAFTRAIGTDSVTVGILPQILAMAEVLKLSVVAEGVETEAQSTYFGGSAKHVVGQGWLFGFPVPAEDFRQTWLGDAGEQVSVPVNARPRKHLRKTELTERSVT